MEFYIQQKIYFQIGKERSDSDGIGLCVLRCIHSPFTIGGNALTNLAGWNEYLVLALTMVVNFVTELLYNQFVVYRKDINTAKPKFDKVIESAKEDNEISEENKEN